jgi:hypothetical protein
VFWNVGENPIFLTAAGGAQFARRGEQPRKIGIGGKIGRIQQIDTVAPIAC